MATTKKQPEKEPDKEDNQELQHGLPVSPSMPYYCTWLPGACPTGDNGPRPKANAQTIAFTHPPICPPPGAGAQTIVPTLVPPCPTMPQVCVPTINPACPQPGAGQANAQTATIITCTGIPIVCGHQPAQAQTFPTTTVRPTFFPPICPPNTATTTVQTGGGAHPQTNTIHVTTTVQTNYPGCTTVTTPPINTHLMGCTTVTAPPHGVGAQAQGFTVGGICGVVTGVVHATTAATVATTVIPGTEWTAATGAVTGALTQVAHCGAQAQTGPIPTQLLCPPPTFPHTGHTLATVCTQMTCPGGLTSPQTVLSVGNICPTANAACNTMATVCTQIACPGHGTSPQGITIGGICGDVTRTITVATTATGTIPGGTVVQATTGVLTHIVHCGAQAQGITIAGICGQVTKTITVATTVTGTVPTGTIIQGTTGILTQIADCGAQAQTFGPVTRPPVCFPTMQTLPPMCHIPPLSAPPNCPLPPHGTQAQLITLNCTFIPIACVVTAVAKC